MKKAILTFAVLTVLTSPSFAQSVGEKTGVNSALGIAPKLSIAAFIRPDGERLRRLLSDCRSAADDDVSNKRR